LARRAEQSLEVVESWHARVAGEYSVGRDDFMKLLCFRADASKAPRIASHKRGVWKGKPIRNSCLQFNRSEHKVSSQLVPCIQTSRPKPRRLNCSKLVAPATPHRQPETKPPYPSCPRVLLSRRRAEQSLESWHAQVAAPPALGGVTSLGVRSR